MNSHCSEEDCKATLDLVRKKIEIFKSAEDISSKNYHLLDELIEQNKKVLFIDSNLDFIKHRK